MLLDNKNNGKVGAELKKRISQGSRLSVLSGLFSIYGFSVLQKELKNVQETRLLLSNWNDDAIPALAGGFTELRLKNQLDQAKIASECVNWLSKKVSVKTMSGQAPVNQNLFHLLLNQEAFAIQGSSHFTAAGLGETKSDSYEMNMGTSDITGTTQLLSWFDAIWNDSDRRHEG